MANVKFKRIANSSTINDYPVDDGSFWVTGDGKSYIDYGQNRVPTNGTLDNQMSDTSRNGVENKVIKEYVDTNKVIVSTVWENPNPTQAFSSQNITLLSSDYDYLDIYYYDWNDSNIGYKDLLCQRIPKGASSQLITGLVYNSKGYFGTRRVTYQDDTTYTVGTGYKIIDNGSVTFGTNNNWNVPVKIISYKYQ